MSPAVAGCDAPQLYLRASTIFFALFVYAEFVDGEDAEPSCPNSLGALHLDRFEESLQLMGINHIAGGRLTSARFEFVVVAPLTSEFRANNFDLFPKPIGKLLNTRPGLSGFEATLTRGRWKEEWGFAPRLFRPPGAVVVASLSGAAGSEDAEAAETWRFLVSALSGSLCASFEGVDPDFLKSSFWVRPVDMPWAAPGDRLRFATLPYEPVCTENLTPWLRLLPCGRRRGLTALIAPVPLAESPLHSLSLAAHVHEGFAELRATLDIVMPAQHGAKGFGAWLKLEGREWTHPCPAASSSTVHVHDSRDPAVAPKVLNTSHFDRTWAAASSFSPPAEAMGSSVSGAGGLTVMRDILSKEAFSERTHGRYLLRLSSVAKRAVRIRFMDDLPFFVRPLWHTIRITIRSGLEEQTLTGWDALRQFQVHFTATDGVRLPTSLSLEANVPAEGTVNIFFDVLKNFVEVADFSYASEKGFDVSSAAWMEVDGAGVGLGCSAGAGNWSHHQQLHFTQGYIIMVPMPDFSMVFNVIALAATAINLFFGSMIKLTAFGRSPHWVLEKDDKVKVVGRILKWTKRLLVLTCLAWFSLSMIEEPSIEALRPSLHPKLRFLITYAIEAKKIIDQIKS